MSDRQLYLVEFDYKAEQQDELSIAKGELLYDAEQEEDGWLRGRNGAGKRGLFPDNFVKPCRPATIRRVDAKLRGAGIDVNTAVYALEPLPAAGGSNGSAVNVYAPKLGSKLSVPATYLDFENNHQQPVQQQPVPRSLSALAGVPASKSFPPPTGPNPAVPDTAKRPLPTKSDKVKQQNDYVIVIHPYTADHQDELTIKVDDVIRVIDRNLSDEGWWRGELNGRVGLFPDNFVEPCAARPPPQAHQLPPTQPPFSAARQVPETPAVAVAAVVSHGSNGSLAGDHHQQHQVLQPTLSHPSAERPKQAGKRPPNASSNSRSLTKEEVNNHDVSLTTTTVTTTQSSAPLVGPLPSGPPGPSDGDSLAVASPAIAELRQELRELRMTAAERDRELQELTRFKRSAMETIMGLKEEVDAIKKNYHACCVDMERLKREVLVLTKNH